MNTAKLLKVLALALLSLVGTACSFEGRDVDPELEPYVIEFEQEFGVHIDIPVRFGELSRHNAVCAATWPKKSVRLSRDILDKTPARREFTMRFMVFHELAHCELGLDHDDTMVLVDGSEVAYSIMHSGKSPSGDRIGTFDLYGSLDWQHYTTELQHKWHNRLESLAKTPLR